MDESTRSGIPLAVQFASRASPSAYEDLGRPFFHELLPALEAAGFGITDPEYIRENFEPPDFTFYPPGHGRPLNSTLFGGLLFGVALFIGGSIGQWSISKLCDDIYKRVGGLVGHLIGRLRPDDRVVTVIFDHWFDSSGVLIRVECKLRAGEPRDVVDALIPVALRRAIVWIEDHGVTHRVVKYTITHGKLADNPALSEPVSMVE